MDEWANRAQDWNVPCRLCLLSYLQFYIESLYVCLTCLLMWASVAHRGKNKVRSCYVYSSVFHRNFKFPFNLLPHSKVSDGRSSGWALRQSIQTCGGFLILLCSAGSVCCTGRLERLRHVPAADKGCARVGPPRGQAAAGPGRHGSPATLRHTQPHRTRPGRWV